MIVGMADNQPTFLVTYSYVPDMENRRTPHRQDHLDWLRAEEEAGRLILAGAMLEPVDGAVLLVRADDSYQVRQWLLHDPYAKAGLITGVTVRKLGLAIGG